MQTCLPTAALIAKARFGFVLGRTRETLTTSMLHDPSHRPQPICADEIKLQPQEKEVLRQLVAELATIAALPADPEKAELWRRLNDLESDRPMVWINEIPWHEMNVDDELTLRTVHPWARDWETTLRQMLYQWRRLPADMIYLKRGASKAIPCQFLRRRTARSAKLPPRFRRRCCESPRVTTWRSSHGLLFREERIARSSIPL
jgi:hypothetical protein